MPTVRTIGKEKLVYVLHEIAIGGAEVAFLSALPRLAEEFDLQVYILHKGNGKLIDTIPVSLKKYLVFCNVSLLAYPFYLVVLAARILRCKPQYLVCSLWRSCLVGTIIKLLDDRISYYPFIHSSIFFHKFDKWASLLAMRKSDKVFVDSLSAHDFVTDVCKVTDKPVIVISFLTTSMPQRPSNYDFRRKHFVFIGRLHPVKNLCLAVRSVAWLRKQGIDAYLDIYGRDDGDAENVLEAIEREDMESFVEWKGELLPSAKAALLTASDYPFYLQLSNAEGMAMSVVEAMQAGKVCILTPVGEIPHYATDDESAIFVDDSSHEAWELSMQRVKAVIMDVENCKQLSKVAHEVFQNRPLFKDSLLAAIRSEGGRLD